MQLNSKKELSSTFIGYQLLTRAFLFQFSLLSVLLEGVEPVIFHFWHVSFLREGSLLPVLSDNVTFSSNMYGVGMITSRTYLLMDHFSPNNPKMIIFILFVKKVFLWFLAQVAAVRKWFSDKMMLTIFP